MKAFIAWLFEPLYRRWCRFERAGGLVLACQDAPDTSGVNRAAEASAALSKEALDFFKSVYAKEAPAREAAAGLNNQVAQEQIKGMQFATQQAQDDAARRRTVFQPMEDRLAADAAAYDTPERRAAEAERAAAGVEASVGRSQQGLMRDIMRRGGTALGGVAGQAMAQDAALAKARMLAGATDAATRNVEQQGYARRMDVASLGRGIASNQATQQQIATNSGNSAVGSNMAGLQATQSGTAAMGQGFNTALAGMGQAGSLYGQEAGIQAQTRGQDLGFLSSIYGTTMGNAGSLMKLSTEKVKKNRAPTDEDAALEEINALPVEEYEYDPARGGPDGMGPQTGPMAERVHAVMGDRVAPGGEAIDYSITGMGGKLIAAVQALSRKVDELQGA
jgi:hypothetical protein